MGKNKICAYSYWGYLGDVKYTKDGQEASTPDGNAFYSWSIIRELQKRDYTVKQVMPNRDETGVKKNGIYSFQAWLPWERYEAYNKMQKVQMDIWDNTLHVLKYGKCKRNSIEIYNILYNRILDFFDYWLEDVSFVLHEWRMKIPGRNDMHSIGKEGWQPDLLIQKCLIKYCRDKDITLFVFDLDYKLDLTKLTGFNNVIIELGNFWIDYIEEVDSISTYIPFDFSKINTFNINSYIKNYGDRVYDLVYIGNRYERDWCIDKYIPSDVNCMIYGNWLEGQRDSSSKWPNLTFGKRLQTRDMAFTYQSAICTILLAKEEYCKYHFMTARLVEAIFYGTVPLFIEEYGEETILEYAGDYASFLTVHSAEEVKEKIEYLRRNPEWGTIIISYLRTYLQKMDVKNFVNVLEGI